MIKTFNFSKIFDLSKNSIFFSKIMNLKVSKEEKERKMCEKQIQIYLWKGTSNNKFRKNY